MPVAGLRDVYRFGEVCPLRLMRGAGFLKGCFLPLTGERRCYGNAGFRA